MTHTTQSVNSPEMTVFSGVAVVVVVVLSPQQPKRGGLERTVVAVPDDDDMVNVTVCLIEGGACSG